MAKEGGKVADKNDSEKRISETCTVGPEASLEHRKAAQQAHAGGM